MACSRPRWHVDCSLGHSALIAFRNDPKGCPDVMWVTCTLTRAREVGAGEIHEKMPKFIEKILENIDFSLIFIDFSMVLGQNLAFSPFCAKSSRSTGERARRTREGLSTDSKRRLVH